MSCVAVRGRPGDWAFAVPDSPYLGARVTVGPRRRATPTVLLRAPWDLGRTGVGDLTADRSNPQSVSPGLEAHDPNAVVTGFSVTAQQPAAGTGGKAAGSGLGQLLPIGRDEAEEFLQRTLGGVLLEGPPDAATAAQNLVDCLRRHERPDELKRAKLAFISVAQECCRPR